LEIFLDIYQTEDEQVEALKKWWQENGKSAIFGVLLGLMAIFGWREWNDYKIEQATAASQLYQQMIQASREGSSDTLSDTAKKISNNYKDTAYAVFAKLATAKLSVADDELESAVVDLRWALDNTSQDSLSHVITLRLIRVLIAQNKLGEAKTLLAPASDSGEFAGSYKELEADILKLEGDTEGARIAYQDAIDTMQSLGQQAPVIDLKLDDLGRSKIK
jgi:predicted negative regulator of RcsB-dependent stress response